MKSNNSGTMKDVPVQPQTTTEVITERIDITSLAEKLWGMLTPCDGLCRLCGGSGHLFCYQNGKREFWDCPACGGIGARALFSRPEVHSHAR